MSHLNMKVDMDHPLFREILDFMMTDKNNITIIQDGRRITTSLGIPTGEALGHSIHWKTVRREDFRYKEGHVCFVFENEADKLLFILKL